MFHDSFSEGAVYPLRALVAAGALVLLAIIASAF